MNGTDVYRKKIVEKGGLKLLTALISKSSNESDAIRTDALKAVVNLSLTGKNFEFLIFLMFVAHVLFWRFLVLNYWLEENEPEFVREQTIPVLVKILGENDTNLQELASLTLENLAYTRNVYFFWVCDEVVYYWEKERIWSFKLVSQI